MLLKRCRVLLLLSFVCCCVVAENLQFDIFRDPIRIPARLPSTQQPKQEQFNDYNGNNPQLVMSHLTPTEEVSTAPGSTSAFMATANVASEEEYKRSPVYSSNDPVDVRISDVLAASVLRFAQNVGKQLSASATKTEFTKSEVFSPLSVMSGMALLLLGAKGRSYQELALLFGIDNDSELRSNPGKLHEQLGLLLTDLQQQDVRYISPLRGEDPWRTTVPAYSMGNRKKNANRQREHIVKVANAVFAQAGYNLNPDYRQVIKTIYHSELSLLDFQRRAAQSRAQINDWVDRNTFGKITNMITDEISQNTKVILASTLYFKAFWDNEFFESATKEDDFFPDGEAYEPIKVNMMATGGVFPFYDAVEYGCRIIGLPYQGNLSTMYIIQPHQSSRAKLQQLQQNLDEVMIERMISKMRKRSALVALPKMHLRHKLELKQLLQRMGVRNIFTAGASDLSLIGTDSRIQQHIASHVSNHADSVPGVVFPRGDFTDAAVLSLNALEAERYANARAPPTADLYVDDVVHKVDFDVNEHGTEAAAATITTLRKSGPEVLFRTDAPFMLLIRHDPTKLILFYGIINEPPRA